MRKLTTLIALGAILLSGSAIFAANDQEVQAQLEVLKNRVAELEAQQNQQALQQRNAELVRQMVKELASQQTNQAQDSGVTAGYDKRFFIKTADDQFRLDLDTLLQFRHAYMNADSCDKKLQTDGTTKVLEDTDGDGVGDTIVDTTDGVDASGHGFELNRARLMMSGHVLKDLKYNVVLDARESDSTVRLYQYDLAYSFMPEFGVRVGKYKAPFSKQETTSSSRSMMVDWSLANTVFNLDRVTGAEIFGEFNLGEVKPAYRAMVFNNARQNDNMTFVTHDNSVDYAGRLMLPLMGATVKDFDNESDLEFHENPVAMIGASAAYLNDRTEDTFVGGSSSSYTFIGRGGEYADGGRDGKGDLFTLGGECEMLAVDASMKYMGFSTTSEVFIQHVDGDSGEIGDASDFGNATRKYLGGDGIDGYEVDNYGWYTQAGYFIVPKKFELTTRVGGVFADNTTDSYEYAGGWNWYLSGQDLKLSMDITYIDRLPVTSDGADFYGVQNNSLLLARTQLQFMF